jgi:PAS domain S-box-containing protein
VHIHKHRHSTAISLGTVQALERISAAALEAHSLDELLQRLLRILVDAMPAVHLASILLRRADVLSVRASVGIEAPAQGFSLAIGEGFAGRVAKERCAQTLRSGDDPVVLDPRLRTRGVKALHGMPLIDGDDLVGVIQIGSLTTHDFSKQNKLLATLATRATAAISQHLLREAAERRARYQAALVAFGEECRELGELRALLERAVRVVAETLGVELVSAIALRPNGTWDVEAVHGWDLETAQALADTDPQVGHTLRTAEPVLVGELQRDDRFSCPAILLDRQVRSSVSVPLPVPGERDSMFGVLSAHALRAYAFTADELGFLESLATVLVAAFAMSCAEAERRRRLEHTQRGRDEAEHALAVIDALLSSSLVGIALIDTQLRYVRINDALAAINGRSPTEHLGHTVREVLGEQADSIEPLLRRIIETGTSLSNFQISAAPPSSPEEVRSFLANYFPVRTPRGESLGVGVAVVEITDRARAEAALRASKDRLKKALSIETVGVLFFRLNGEMLDANGALERMSGYTTEELRSIGLTALTPPEFAGIAEATAQCLATVGEASPYEQQWIRPDGSRWWGLFAPTRLSGHGLESQCVEFIIDITERKRAEEAAQNAIRAREEILGIVSHDLKNPLGTVQLASALLAQTVQDPHERKQVDTIVRAANRMEYLIHDLLDMASIQAGRLAIECEAVEPESLVREAIEMHETVATEKRLQITTAFALHGRRVWCDRDRILQVLGNLLGNAIKFCRPGDTISVRVAAIGREARFAISDTGPGIPPGDLPHLFEPYWSAKRHAKQGTGLGLFISKGILDAHGGRCWAESPPGGGATFFFTLPLG